MMCKRIKRALSERVCEAYEICTTILVLLPLQGKLSRRISVYRGTRLSRNESQKASLFDPETQQSLTSTD